MSQILSGIIERSKEIQTELFRKSIHLLVGAVPLLAAMNLGFTRIALVLGIAVFLYAEKVRLSGGTIPLITNITNQASRQRDTNKMVLGPLTLAFGALFTLIFFKEPTASVGIFALAFGDGLSSVVGKIFGRVKLPFTGGKTLEGTLTVFLVVLPVALAAGGTWNTALIVAGAAAFLEALPLEDLDNLILPLGTAFLFNLLR
ncbi:MAG: hypothetical protein A2Z96_07235 [Spirochaetes bacterium GWB1_48_6]|nr:MAG: hypothetical protein A2Z96_07235 [Spirochaetes bacterium GWB1_48_6]